MQDSVYDITLSSLMNCMSSTCMSISFTSDNPLYKACSVMCFSANVVAMDWYYTTPQLIACSNKEREQMKANMYVTLHETDTSPS